MGWLSDIVGGTILRIPKIQSPGFVSGSTGWSINQDGSVEFNNGVFRGTISASVFEGTDFVINANGAFWYSGTPAAGNLILSIASVGGTDDFGNSYPQGLAGFQNTGTLTAVGVLNTKYISIQGGSLSQIIEISPDQGTWNAGSIESSSGNGKILVTAPQLIADTGNGANLTLSPASPAGAGNAAIDLQADKITVTTGTPGTPRWTYDATAQNVADAGAVHAAAASGQGAAYGWAPTISRPAGALAASVRPQWTDQQGATWDLTRPPGVWPPELSGMRAWTGDPITCTQTSTASSGLINLTALWISSPCTLSTIEMFMSVNGSTLTPGECFAGLYDASGTRLGVTADQSLTWASAATEGPWSASIGTVTIPKAGWYYAAWLWNGTTSPSWATHAQLIANTVGIGNLGFPSGQGRYMKSVASFTSLPSSLPAFTGANWSLATFPFFTAVK